MLPVSYTHLDVYKRQHEDYKFKSDVDAAVRFFHENDLAGCGWVMKCSEGSTEVEVTLDCNKTLTCLLYTSRCV